MTKTELQKDFGLDAAPADVKAELSELLADMPEELTEDQLKQIIVYVTSAQERETQLALAAEEAALTAEQYANDVDDALDAEDIQIANELRTNMQAAQDLAA